tara:strand:- start:202 stop:1725 length:1524 start_codon:yes stop_codon:yes gene_type:complete
MITKQKIIYLVLFFPLILLLIPTFSLTYDLWDGVIIQFAAETNNFSGLEVYFFESRWFLQHYLSLLIIFFSDFLNLDYKNFNAIVVYLTFIVFIFENYYLAKNIFNLKLKYQIWYLALISTFPAFSVFTSSIMTFHLLCFTLSLVGIRFINTKENNLKKLIGYFLIFISFNFNSLLVFSPLLSLVYDRFKQRKNYISLNTIIVLLISIVVFFFRSYFEPFGEYEKYNELIIFNKEKIGEIFMGIYYFSSYPILIIFTNVIIIFFLNIKNFKININKVLINKFFYLLIPIIILFFAGSFPYIAVGKWAGYWDVKEWTSRQAILISIPFSLFAIYFTKNIMDFLILEEVKKRFLTNLILSLILITNILFFSFGILEKLNRNIYENKLSQVLQKTFEEPIQPGYVQFYGNNVPGPNFRLYEVNFLLYKTFKQRSYFAKFSEYKDLNFKLDEKILRNDKYKIKYIFNDNLDCSTYINLKNYNFVKTFDKLKNVFRFQNPIVKINKTETICK